MDRPLVSIVMPTHNSGAFLEEAVASVRAQTITDWELLLVDDASTDGSADLARNLQVVDPRIRIFLKAENQGPAVSRNIALEHARGRYIAFLDSDDLWRPKKLERQLALLRCGTARLVYSAYEKVDESGRATGRVIRVPARVDYAGLLRATVIATSSAMIDTERTGPVRMPELRKRQDYGLWLSLLRDGGHALAVEEPLMYLRKRPGSVSSNKISAIYYTWLVYRRCEGLPVGRSLFYMAHYTTRALRKTLV